jgi:signal transduction histidine kinase
LKNKIYSDTLANIIKQNIRKRIYIALALILIIPILLLSYFCYTAVKLTKNDVNLEIGKLADNIIGQYLVNNKDAIRSSILSFNQSHLYYKVIWQDSKTKIFKNPEFYIRLNSFMAVYPIRTIVGSSIIHAGYFVVNGKLIINHREILVILVICAVIMSFTLILYVLLIPLANRIPGNLIIQPIHSLINAISHNECAINTIPIASNCLEFQQIDKQIRNLILRLKKQEKDVAFTTIARKVIHDIKSPLKTAVLCNRALSIQKNINNDLILKIDRALQNIHYQLCHLFNNVEKKSKPENTTLLPRYTLFKYCICDLIADKIIELNHMVKFEIIDNISDDDVWCYLEPYMLVNNISNLINNASDALEQKFNKQVNDINIILLEDKVTNMLVVEIRDDGYGMNSDIITKAIEGYSTRDKGSGIGLSSALKYFKNIGGDLNINSIPDVGTIVTVKVPKTNAPTWFTKNIKLTNYIVVLDDDFEVHRYLQSVFYDISEVRYFTKVTEFKQWQNSNNIDEITYFIDNNIEYNDILGVDLINSYEINSKSYLITDDYENRLLQQKVMDLGIVMLPKKLLKLIFKRN